MKVNDLNEKERGDVEAAWQEFKKSEMVDVERTEQEGAKPPKKSFCTNIYGIEYNPETKYWVPFRHGDIIWPSSLRTDRAPRLNRGLD